MKDNRAKIIKLVTFVVFILIMIFLTIKLLPIFKSISTEEGRLNFKQDMENLGANGIFAIIALMIAQIFLPILPRRASRSFSRNVLWSNRRNVCNFYRSVYK